MKKFSAFHIILTRGDAKCSPKIQLDCCDGLLLSVIDDLHIFAICFELRLKWCQHCRNLSNLKSIAVLCCGTDLIVGAPFEGPGAVYIFLGSPAGLRLKYSQRIVATDLSPASRHSLAAFGYSLSAGVDVDDNGYPDVVVGAFQSDAVVILRSRPVVNVMTTLRAYPKVIDPKLTQCRRDGLPYNCFKLQACLRFTVSPADRWCEHLLGAVGVIE